MIALATAALANQAHIGVLRGSNVLRLDPPEGSTAQIGTSITFEPVAGRCDCARIEFQQSQAVQDACKTIVDAAIASAPAVTAAMEQYVASRVAAAIEEFKVASPG